MLTKRLLLAAAAIPVVLAAVEIKVPDTTKLSAYAENAFPVPERPAVKHRLVQKLQQLKAAARWTDAKIEKAYGPLPSDHLFKVRAAKRQEIRNRLFLFIEHNLKRGDATGLGFAEQGLADAVIGCSWSNGRLAGNVIQSSAAHGRQFLLRQSVHSHDERLSVCDVRRDLLPGRRGKAIIL